MKKGIGLIVLLLSLISVYILINSVDRSISQRSKVEIPKVKVFKYCRAENPNLSLKYNGTVQGRSTVNLVAEVGGKIVEVNPRFREGLILGSEEVLKIDPSNYELQTRQFSAEIRVATSALQLEEARSKVGEFESKVAKEDNPIIKRVPQREEKKAQVALARARYARAKLDLERTKLISPFVRTLILATNYSLHDFVPAGGVVATIADVSSYTVKSEIPQTLQKFIKKAFIMQENNVVYGKITSFGQLMNPSTKQLKIEVEFNNVSLLIGNFIDLHLELDLNSGHVIPLDSYVSETKEGGFIFSVEDGMVRKVRVLKKQFLQDSVLVESEEDLEGMNIVTYATSVSEGIKVQIIK